jgi:hypothetical protein
MDLDLFDAFNGVVDATILSAKTKADSSIHEGKSKRFKISKETIENENIVEDNTSLFSTDTNNQIEDNKPIAKKRGRKPKGGKIIQQIVPLNNSKESKPNIILHLKCSIKDLCLNILFFDFKIMILKFI